MPKRRNREVPAPAPIQSDGLYQLEQFYEQAIARSRNELSGYRPLVELDPKAKRPLRFDEATRRFVPIESWEQVLHRSGVMTDGPQEREALRVYWERLERVTGSRDVPALNCVAVYLRRDGSWLTWLARGIDEQSGVCIDTEQVLKVDSLRKLRLPDGYVPYRNPDGVRLCDHAAQTIRNVLSYALGATIRRHDAVVASMRHVQYAQGV